MPFLGPHIVGVFPAEILFSIQSPGWDRRGGTL